MKYTKPPLSIEQQANLLLTRGIIGDKSLIISRLCVVNYYRLSGYWFPFRQIDNSFKPNTTFEQIAIFLPPLPEQKAIAAVLSSLDDKIELLRRQNKTLESIAQMIFKEWFINFTVNGKKLKINDQTGLPEGWRMGKLGEATKIVYGKNLPTDNLTQNGYPVFGGNGQIGFYEKYLYEHPQVLVSCRGEASGKVNISLPKSFVTNNSLILEIRDKSTINFCFLKYFSLKVDYTNYVSGSAQPQITIESIKECHILLPTKEILSIIQMLIRPLEEKMLSNFYQFQTLSKLRDSLLPKLMRGEIRVKECLC